MNKSLKLHIRKNTAEIPAKEQTQAICWWLPSLETADIALHFSPRQIETSKQNIAASNAGMFSAQEREESELKKAVMKSFMRKGFLKEMNGDASLADAVRRKSYEVAIVGMPLSWII